MYAVCDSDSIGAQIQPAPSEEVQAAIQHCQHLQFCHAPKWAKTSTATCSGLYGLQALFPCWKWHLVCHHFHQKKIQVCHLVTHS